jgi:hypothetical protein
VTCCTAVKRRHHCSRCKQKEGGGGGATLRNSTRGDPILLKPSHHLTSRSGTFTVKYTYQYLVVDKLLRYTGTICNKTHIFMQILKLLNHPFGHQQSSSSSSTSSSALQPWVGLGLLKQMSPATFILGIRPPISTTQFPCVVLYPVNRSWFRSATSSFTSKVCLQYLSRYFVVILATNRDSKFHARCTFVSQHETLPHSRTYRYTELYMPVGFRAGLFILVSRKSNDAGISGFSRDDPSPLYFTRQPNAASTHAESTSLLAAPSSTQQYELQNRKRTARRSLRYPPASGSNTAIQITTRPLGATASCRHFRSSALRNQVHTSDLTLIVMLGNTTPGTDFARKQSVLFRLNPK